MKFRNKDSPFDKYIIFLNLNTTYNTNTYKINFQLFINT